MRVHITPAEHVRLPVFFIFFLFFLHVQFSLIQIESHYWKSLSLLFQTLDLFCLQLHRSFFVGSQKECSTSGSRKILATHHF